MRKQDCQGFLWVKGKPASRDGNLRRAVPMNQSNHQIAQRRKNLWGLVRPDVRMVFLKGDDTDIMEPILNPPVTPDELE
jgi:hypothetical protein